SRSAELCVFSTYPVIPTCSALATYGSSEYMVSKMARVLGETCAISWAASEPLSCGMARSRIATSGVTSWASRMASRPSSASATISNPYRSSRVRIPWRKITWSSASRMRSGAEVAAGSGADVAGRAESLGTLEGRRIARSEEHTSELQSRFDLVCRLLLEKKKQKKKTKKSDS